MLATFCLALLLSVNLPLASADDDWASMRVYRDEYECGPYTNADGESRQWACRDTNVTTATGFFPDVIHPATENEVTLGVRLVDRAVGDVGPAENPPLTFGSAVFVQGETFVGTLVVQYRPAAGANGEPSGLVVTHPALDSLPPSSPTLPLLP